MKLEPVTYWRLECEDGQIAVGMERDCEMALRWHPEIDPGDFEFWDGLRTRHRGVSALKQLAAGEDLSPRQMVALHDYIDRAVVYYRERETLGIPVLVDSNRTAITDLLVIHEAIEALP